MSIVFIPRHGYASLFVRQSRKLSHSIQYLSWALVLSQLVCTVCAPQTSNFSNGGILSLLFSVGPGMMDDSCYSCSNFSFQHAFSRDRVSTYTFAPYCVIVGTVVWYSVLGLWWHQNEGCQFSLVHPLSGEILSTWALCLNPA